MQTVGNFFANILNRLDSYALEIGSFQISVLGLIKGFLAFVLLYWIVKGLVTFLRSRLNSSGRLTGTQKVLYLKIINILLIATAVFVGLSIIGIDITALAIFSSAVGIGIGFGLQKVISNFICGIIILTDRSIRPGDVIAVGDTYGEVKNLEARYVSIVTRDGKAHLIPNETLVTEKVENWSYNNRELRLKIPVGVGYESDVRLVQKLLIEAGTKHHRVLSDPEPKALIREFAGSTINFELRVWIDDPANGVRSPQSEIYFLIWDKFKEHNIELPFPQLEIRTRPIQEDS